MAKYRVLRGQHREGGKTFRRGSVVESDTELDVKFGAEKYALIGDRPRKKKDARFPATSTSVPGGLASDPNVEGDEADSGESGDDDDEDETRVLSDEELQALTVYELRQLAEDEEIDLGAATRKDAIISTIKAAQGRLD